MCLYSRSLNQVGRFKARETHVFFLYVLFTALRVIDDEDLCWAHGPVQKEFGKTFRLAITYLLCGLHLVKGFSMNVSLRTFERKLFCFVLYLK